MSFEHRDDLQMTSAHATLHDMENLGVVVAKIDVLIDVGDTVAVGAGNDRPYRS